MPTSTNYASTLVRQFKAATHNDKLDLDESARLLDVLKDARKAGGEEGKKAEAALRKLLSDRGDKFGYRAKRNIEDFLARPRKISAAALADGRKMVADAKANGRPTIEAKELNAMFVELHKKYGQQIADEVIRRSLFGNAEHLELRAAKWLQGHIGNMDGHIARYQQVAAGYFEKMGVKAANLRLVDANFDGKLDENDVLVYKTGGRTYRRKLHRALKNRLEIGKAVVSAAHDMAEAKHDFSLLSEQTFNKKYWMPEPKYGKGSKTGQRGTFTLKPGVKASDALLDIFDNPHKYEFECATAMVITYYKAMYDLLGPKDFDRKIGPQLRIGVWESEGNAQLDHSPGTKGKKSEIKTKTKKAVRPGDYAYIRNWDASKEGVEAGWQGENVIYLGDGLYYGHPFGIASADEIVRHLDEWRKEGSSKSASLQDTHGYMSPSVLKRRSVR